MDRNLTRLAQETFDIVIIGGGIYGATLAWEAASRGLSTALVEKSDFASATSANSLKIIHGGFRYLQNLDFYRIRESIRERRALMTIAPHLVHPLPVLIPTYGHGIRSREVLSLALLVNELISLDRNQINDPQKYIPSGSIISKDRCLEMAPGIPEKSLTGGIIFYDAQVYNSERLVLAFLKAAYQKGAAVANYVEAIGFLEDGEKISGVKVEDRISGDDFDIRGKVVVNASGPWLHKVLGMLNSDSNDCIPPFGKAVNLITRKIFDSFAVGLYGHNVYAPDFDLEKKSYLFIAPWREYSLIGTTYTISDQSPELMSVSEKEAEFFINQINGVLPGVNLDLSDIQFIHGGLLPLGSQDASPGSVPLSRDYKIIDHRKSGVKGLISIEGVKYTTARDVAERTIDYIFRNIWNKQPAVSVSAHTSLPGGDIEKFSEYQQKIIKDDLHTLHPEQIARLINNYGTEYQELLSDFIREDPEGLELSDELAVIQSQVRYAVKEEMALKLNDIILRRTELGSAGQPSEEILKFCAKVMAFQLGWSPVEAEEEIDEVLRYYKFDWK